jgi:hypothetical protein
MGSQNVESTNVVPAAPWPGMVANPVDWRRSLCYLDGGSFSGTALLVGVIGIVTLSVLYRRATSQQRQQQHALTLSSAH